MSLTSTSFDKLIIDTIDTVTAFDKTDGSILFMLDQIKDGTIENASETVYGTGRAGVRLSALNRNKTSKFTCNNGYVVASALAAQIGSEIMEASASEQFAVPHIQFIEVTDPAKVTLEFVPVGAAGNEVPFIYKANPDKTQGEKFAAAAAVSDSTFKLDAATKELTLPTDQFAAGDVVIVPYDRKASVGKKLINKGDHFSRTAKLVIDVTCREIADQDKLYHTVFIYPNCKIDGNFTMTFGNEPMAHSVTAEALQDICSANKELFTYYIA